MARTQAAGMGSWVDHLPFVLLGLRTAIREDSACCPADLVFGSPLRLPADLVDPSAPPTPSPSSFVEDLGGVLRRVAPMPFEYHGNTSSRVPSALASCSHVFLRVDAVRRPLVPPYEGPFEVLQKDTKTFLINKAGKEYRVSVDRLKPALTSDFHGSPAPPLRQVAAPAEVIVPTPVSASPP